MTAVLTEAMEQVRIEMITPGEARRILTEEGFPRQRPLSAVKVDRMAAAITEGRFPLTLITWVLTNAGELFLVDGQHRLSALIMADRALRVVSVTEGVKDLNAAGDYYARLDVGNSQRLAQDFLQAYGMEEHYGIGRQNATYFIRAINVIEDRFRLWRQDDPGYKAHIIRRGDPGRIMERFLPWLPACRDYARILREPRQGRVILLRRKGVAAVALVTLADCKERAVKFWEDAAGAPVEPDTGPGALISQLAQTKGSVSGRSEEKRTLNTAALAAACWNAFYEERPISTFRGRWKETGVVILGTRLAGTPKLRKEW